MCRIRDMQPRYCNAATCLRTSIDEYSVGRNIHLPKLRKLVKIKIHLHQCNADKQSNCVETVFYRAMESEK